jgi:peptide-methionine (R)-S-oxide reductase
MDKIEKTLDEWRKQLSPEQFQVCRMGTTERPFSGQYNAFDEPGVYQCACCAAPLFDASSKFDAGCGWPSYYEPINEQAVVNLEDNSHGMQRVEVRCARCDAHLGHVFPDGPPPTGLRYCINSVVLTFQPRQ